MCDDETNPWLPEDIALSRRSFGIGAGAVVALTAAEARAQAAVTEKDVVVKTADGESDAALFYPPGKGRWPAVLIWTDIAGLRPAFRDMGKRLAAQGYVVLVPNPFYRSAKPAAYANLSFGTDEGRKTLFSYRGAMTNDGIDKDAAAYVAFLDAQPQTSKKKSVGVQGYCMGGPLSFRTAAAVPGRIGAVGSFHGGGLTTKLPDSPHLLVAKSKAAYAVCVAQNDDKNQPESKDILKATFAETKRPGYVEVYAANHGWCVPGSAVDTPAEADRAWGVLSEMYRKTL